MPRGVYDRKKPKPRKPAIPQPTNGTFGDPVPPGAQIAEVRPMVQRPPSHLFVDVDWQNIPMDEARLLYARLKEQFEKAGSILNARLMPPSIPRYACFMCECTCVPKSASLNPIEHQRGCKKVHDGEARGKDDSYKDPKSGLYVPVRICGERHWIEFQNILIAQRREKNLIPRSS